MKKNNCDFSVLAHFSNGIKNLFFTVKYLNGESETLISDAVEEITGYTAEEIRNFPENLYSLIHNEDSAQIKKALIEFENDPLKKYEELIYRIISKRGEVVWLKEFISVEREKGKIICRKSIVLNISEIKKGEKKLQILNDSLKELNSQKDQFISIISHDLRAPFTTLLGFSEILLNEQDISDDEKNEYLQYIYDSSKSQLHLINCLLDWSRLQTGRIKINPARLNVKTIVANSITPLTGDAVRKNINIRTDIPADLHINADERLIGQAIINLTSNAIKFTPERKEIHISASRFKEGEIELVVRDEGLGISEEHQSNLFRIDKKFSLVGTNGEKGSGLGLTLVKEIVEKHNGRVWFYSQVGEGSEFHFTIPEAKNFVLLVEDDQGERAFYKKIIEEALPNFEVRFADNGYEAIGLFRDILPTIVITDHDMPLMNGIQFVDAIQKKESNKTTPIVVITAVLSEEITKKYRKLGVDKIISKPVDRVQLVQAIRECLY